MAKLQIFKLLNNEMFDKCDSRSELTEKSVEGVHYEIIAEREIDRDFFWNKFIHKYNTDMQLWEFIYDVVAFEDEYYYFMIDRNMGSMHEIHVFNDASLTLVKIFSEDLMEAIKERDLHRVSDCIRYLNRLCVYSYDLDIDPFSW